MISASATGMSNGGRCSSASPATKKTNSPGSCHSSHHGVQESAITARETEPAAIAAEAAASTNGSSYDISCAATRRPPSSENLLALDQPAISEPSTPTLISASTKNRLGSMIEAAWSGATGITTRTTRYGISATAGASRKTVRSAAAGMTSSFWTNFTPSATSCAQPWKPPAYIGPTRACMCAIALCSVWPTSSGRTRNATSTTASRSIKSHQSTTGLILAHRGHRTTDRPCRASGRLDPMRWEYTPPTRDILGCVERSVGPGRRVVGVDRLRGGLTAAMDRSGRRCGRSPARGAAPLVHRGPPPR